MFHFQVYTWGSLRSPKNFGYLYSPIFTGWMPDAKITASKHITHYTVYLKEKEHIHINCHITALHSGAC